MNKFKIIFIFFCQLYFAQNIYANRGDIVSYELIEEWDSKKVISESYSYIENLINGASSDATTSALIKKFVKTYIAVNIKARTLKIYKVEYKTIDFEDNEAIASGLIIVPQRPNGKCSYGIGVYGHGTLFAKQDAPSLFYDNGNFRKEELFFPIIFSAMEYITAVPDYFGLGTGTGFHHHNMDKTNSNSTIDIIRAARNLAAQLSIETNNTVSITGYSEGGTVAMSTAKRIFEEGLQNEFQNLLVCPASGAYDMGTEAYNYILNNPYYPTRAYILYVASSCQDMYKNLYDPANPNGISKYIKPPYDSLYNENFLKQNGNVGWVPLPWTDMFWDNEIDSARTNPQHPLRTCLEKNNSYDWPNPFKTYIYYCNTDEQVPPSGAVKAYNTQLSYIPPDRFWDRYRLQIQELSFDGFFSEHAFCAVPSMLLTIENFRANRNIKCKSNGRLSTDYLIDNSEKLQSYEVPINTSTKSLEVLDMNNKKFNINADEQNKFNISNLKPGFYLYNSTENNEFTDLDYFIKLPYNYVNTDDYNPIQLNEKNEYFVDLSRLDESVKRIDILDEKNKPFSLYLTDNTSKKIILPSQILDGEYTVMVVTNENNYPLLWKKKSLIENNKLNSFNIINAKNEINIQSKSGTLIQSIDIVDITGKNIFTANNINSSTFQSIIPFYADGIYFVSINHLEAQKMNVNLK